MTESIHLLVGPYVLDALDDTETIAFEEHLRGCEDCRQEVSELRETAALLGKRAGRRRCGRPEGDSHGAGLANRPVASTGPGCPWQAASGPVAGLVGGRCRGRGGPGSGRKRARAAAEDHRDERAHHRRVMALITADDAKVMPSRCPRQQFDGGRVHAAQ